jgi:hypothetical protein
MEKTGYQKGVSIYHGSEREEAEVKGRESEVSTYNQVSNA